MIEENFVLDEILIMELIKNKHYWGIKIEENQVFFGVGAKVESSGSSETELGCNYWLCHWDPTSHAYKTLESGKSQACNSSWA